MSKWERTGIECPCGHSSDAFSIDRDGNGYCFSGGCGEFFHADELEDYHNKEDHHKKTPIREVTKSLDIENIENIERKIYPHRGLSWNTLSLYGIETKFINGRPASTAFLYPELEKRKFRNMTDEGQKYYSDSGLINPGLYGKHAFPPGSKPSVTVCEGMYDSPSVYEMIQNTAAVSVSSSGQALRDVIQDRDYLNSFDRIYLCLDSDVHGEEATRAIATAGIFDHNKLFIVRYSRFKDPSEFLQNGSECVNEFISCWKGARKYSPDNIISTFSEIEKALDESQESQLGTYPFAALNKATYGIHAGEIVVFKGPEGIGKTEVFRATEKHLLETTDHPIGIVHLEEDNGTTVRAIAGYELSIPATLPDCGLTKEDIMNAYRKAVRDNEGRLHIYESFETEDEKIFLDNFRFLGAVAGCKIIFFDHMQWTATGMEDEDERKKLDRLSQRLKLLAKELGIAIIEISHTNDNGQTRGSRNISKVANTVVSLSRDMINFDPVIKNRTHFLVEKVRLGGQTGPAGYADFNQRTGRLEDVS